MRRSKFITVAALILIGGLGVALIAHASSQEKDEVRRAVSYFGKILQGVPLAAPEEVLKTSIKENYKEVATPDVIMAWQNDPTRAPGRLSSSPWPDRIEINSMDRRGNFYIVKGTVIEITSAELQTGGIAAAYPVSIALQKVDDRWMVSGFEK